METMDRPAWPGMLKARHADGAKTILDEKLDRVAPYLMVREAAIADLHKHGFGLVSVQESNLMACDPTRVLCGS